MGLGINMCSTLHDSVSRFVAWVGHTCCCWRCIHSPRESTRTMFASFVPPLTASNYWRHDNRRLDDTMIHLLTHQYDAPEEEQDHSGSETGLTSACVGSHNNTLSDPSSNSVTITYSPPPLTSAVGEICDFEYTSNVCSSSPRRVGKRLWESSF